MTRKDIIIISVLVNAGLLAILFVMAINTQEDGVVEEPSVNLALHEKKVVEPTIEPEIIPLASLNTTSQGEDELDRVLKDYAIPVHAEIYDEENPENFQKEIEVAQITPSGRDEGGFIEITVKRGDALEKIARANGVTVSAIKKINNLKNEKISIGQVLKIPKAKLEKDPIAVQDNKPAKKTEKNVDSSDNVVYYTIKSGDNPWKIAKQHHVNFEDLLRLNQLDEEKARNLKIGDRIRVK